MIVHMIGNAHIDPVWLWTWQSGIDEVLATCASAADRCDEYPEFIFTRGEAWVYQQIQNYAPDLFDRITKLIERGQWHITGGQWIQPDVNLPTARGLRRQIIHGQRYFQKHFGITPDIGYNVDSFGHPATMPDILAEMNCRGYVFHRPNEQQTSLPAATFRWRGVGGGEVMGFRIPAPYTTRAEDLYGQIMLSLDAADDNIGHVMCFYGVGNHGGGPTKRNIEYILANKNAFDGAELRFSTPEAFFDAVAPKREHMPVVDFELQRTFPGCYVVMQDMKRLQRHAELRAAQAQQFVDRFAAPADQPALIQSLDAAWEDLLFTEFHDILAGTSIPAAWDAVRDVQGRARQQIEEVIALATRRHARINLPPVDYQQIAVFNPGPEAFDGFVEHEPFLDFDPWKDRWLADEHGRAIPYQFVQAQSTIMLTPAMLFPTKIDAGAVKIITVRDAPCPTEPVMPTTLRVDTTTLANDRVSVRVGPKGIQQITAAGRDLLGDAGIRLRLREDSADTWGFHITSFVEPIIEHADACEWVVEEPGPLRGRLRTDVTIGRSQVRWTLTLYHDRPEIDCELDIVFDERFKMLQLPIALASDATHWRCGLAGGAVTREAGEVEWPLQGWAYAQPRREDDSVLATLTQDANSASLDQNQLTWSLLRSTRMAWSGEETSMDAGRGSFTDRGVHRVAMCLVPLTPDAETDQTLTTTAERLAQPLVAFDRYEGMQRPPWKNNPPRRLWTAAEHRARADGRMMHLESDGTMSVEER